ncbi:MAG: cytochrome b/b6 domain-containing protein [Anaerolineales bacterium]|nr:cytochrome b/b6 domain-containing protein [Anaerolineales bacterium]
MRKKLTLLALILGIAGLVVGQAVWAQDDGEALVPEPTGSPIHPTFALLDANGNNVLDSGEPVSTTQTCGACHDADFIVTHSFHADVGLSSFTEAGTLENGRVWDSSAGYFGKWNPFGYRYLSPAGDDIIDMTTPEWLMYFGARHVGGGPAEYGRDGQPLTSLPASADNPETSIFDLETDEMVAWDWNESGVVEMNCFLCHTINPNNEARVASLASGEFKWANTATLLGTGIVDQSGTDWQYNETAFAEDGTLQEGAIAIQDPSNENCSQCHGLVHVDAQTPLVLEGCSADQWSTITTGQIVSPQKLNNSGMNLADKNELTRSWDVHAERVINCTDCHYSLNNPIYYQEADDTRPDHLLFDPRRIDIGEYLYRPLHQFAKGSSAQGTLAPELDNTLRRCESCHSIDATHDWLPYKERHTDALSCESCHIPQMYSSARQSMDWTVLQLDSTPQSECRGTEGEGETFSSVLITGYQPVLLPRDNGDGTTSLAPHNLITTWFWVYGDPPRPVPLRNLEAAWLDGDNYHDDIMSVFDHNGDGKLDDSELIIDSIAKEEVITNRLIAQGLTNLRITGEIQPYSINHDVTHDEWVTQDCQTCHGTDSRITQPLQLAGYAPAGVMPTLVQDTNTSLSGNLYTDDNGKLFYQPLTENAGLYVLGHDNVNWIDLAGALIFIGTVLGASVHGGLRYFAVRRRAPHEPELRQVYMYTVYERLWHWLQTVAIMLLLFTGLVIHKPELFGAFSFRYMVQVHNVLAAILVLNAFLSAFYHFASGEIKQFLPEPHGFFRQAIEQTSFYLSGIFKGEEHPVEKTRDRKMNPLQQVTYLAILNVLLPLQIITGALMWGVQRWPNVAAQLGGLPFLAPFHTIIAWLFASFIVMHVYLTTTGHTATAGIKSMIMGWDDVEVHAHPQD